MLPSLKAKLLFILSFSILLSACSTLPDQQNLNQRAQQLAVKSSKSDQSLLQQAKLHIQKAHSESLAFYAPTYLENAEKDYAIAQADYQAKHASQDIRLHAQLAIEWVNAGIRNKKMVREYLSKSLDNRQVLLELKAQEHFPNAFKAIEQQHLALIKLVEQREEKKAREQEKSLLQEMSELEINTIGKTYLSQAYLMLKQAQELNAEKQLPKTYAEALNQIKDTEQFIRQNPRDKITIDDLAKDCLFASERLYSLSRLAQQMQLAEPQSLESLVLKHENQLQRIAEAINHKDIRNLSFEDQSVLLSQFGKKLLQSKQHQPSAKQDQAELEKWKRKVVLLQAEIRRLQKLQP